MCKIVKYWFTCHHGFNLQRSRCGGTKHKHRRDGPSPACRSDPYLSLVLPTTCGPCQLKDFESVWIRKLSIPDLFLTRLNEHGFPGVPEVSVLIEQLRDEFNTASWGTRTLFPHSHKAHTTRVHLGRFERVGSPLRREVALDEIRECPEVIDYSHPDYIYDGDYIASTDPLHPVDVRYAHSLDDVDTGWVRDHLSPEEWGQMEHDMGFINEDEASLWAGCSGHEGPVDENWREDTEDGPTETRDQTVGSAENQKTRSRYQAVEEELRSSMSRDDELAKRIEMVISAFWSVVNGADRGDQVSQRAMSQVEEDMCDCVNSLHMLRVSNE